MDIKMSINGVRKEAKFFYVQNGKKRVLYIPFKDLIDFCKAVHGWNDDSFVNVIDKHLYYNPMISIWRKMSEDDEFVFASFVKRSVVSNMLKEYAKYGKHVRKRNNSPWVLEVA